MNCNIGQIKSPSKVINFDEDSFTINQDKFVNNLNHNLIDNDLIEDDLYLSDIDIGNEFNDNLTIESFGENDINLLKAASLKL